LVAFSTASRLPLAKNLIFDKVGLTSLILVNCIADTVLIYRIFLIWESKIWAIGLPILASVATNSVGLAAVIMIIKGAYTVEVQFDGENLSLMNRGERILLGVYVAMAAVNIMLTLTLAGRIIWVTRQIREITNVIGGHKIMKKYNTLVAILLECGTIYPISLIVLIISVTIDTPILPVDFLPLAIQVAGIAPTLIIARTCLGRNTTEHLISSLSQSEAVKSPIQFRSQRTLEGTSSFALVGHDIEAGT